MTEQKINILLGCTGSVATIKIPNIVQGNEKFNVKGVFKCSQDQKENLY
jgi:hypothetical protein